MVTPANQSNAARLPDPSRPVAPTGVSITAASLANDQFQVSPATTTNVINLNFSDVEYDQAYLNEIKAIGQGDDPAQKIRLQHAIDRWTRQALDACFKAKTNQDEQTALTGYHAEMEAFAKRVDLVPMVQQGIRNAVAKHVASLQPATAKPKGFLAKAYNDVAGFIGGIMTAVSMVTNTTLDAVGWIVEKVFHFAGMGLGLPVKGIGLALDAMGAHGAAKGFRTGARWLGSAFDFAGKQIRGFLSGFGEAIKATFDGLRFMLQHPILAVTGLGRMIIHPSVLLVGMKAMWDEGCQGGVGHAVGYFVGTMAPVFLSDGATDSTLVGKLANSEVLQGTKASKAIVVTSQNMSNSMEIARRMATFDVGGVIDGITNFGKPLVSPLRGGSLTDTARAIGHAATHPGDTARAIAADARKVPTRLKAKGLAIKSDLGETRTSATALVKTHGNAVDRVLAARAAFDKAGESAEDAATLARQQEIADKVEATLASSELRTAFRALYKGDYAAFNQAIGNGADAVGKIKTLQNTINDISKVSNVVGDVTNPGGKLEGTLTQGLINATGHGLSNNEAMTLMTYLHLNQEAVYAGDEARLEQDRANGILKVLNPL